MEISVIVPVYKGNKYVSKIIKCVEACVKMSRIDTEIIFVNDYPEEKLEFVSSDYCNLYFVENETNQGIHRTRIKGLEKASGKFVIFLDQDDYIRPNYINSQLKNIGDADAIVCKLLNGGKEHYTSSFKLEEVICKDFMMNNWCSIVSPGQVLIRKKSISDIWINNYIQHNGADDYFLWLAMFANGCKFVTNNEILFEHTINGFNTSSDTNLMIDSEKEVIDILQKSDLFNENEKLQLKCLEDSLRKIHIKQLDNICVSFYLSNHLKNFDLEQIQRRYGKRIGIYGAADIGTTLFNGLKRNTQFEICFIDRNAAYIEHEVTVFMPHEIPSEIDTIVIAIREKHIIDLIKEYLLLNTKCRVISLSEFLDAEDMEGRC